MRTIARYNRGGLLDAIETPTVGRGSRGHLEMLRKTCTSEGAGECAACVRFGA